jgi:hypothetical protein
MEFAKRDIQESDYAESDNSSIKSEDAYRYTYIFESDDEDSIYGANAMETSEYIIVHDSDSSDMNNEVSEYLETNDKDYNSEIYETDNKGDNDYIDETDKNTNDNTDDNAYNNTDEANGGDNSDNISIEHIFIDSFKKMIEIL